MTEQSLRLDHELNTGELPALEGLYGMLNVFVDPAATVRRITARYAWLWPMLTMTTILIVVGMLMMPYTQQLIDARIAAAPSLQNAEHARDVATTVAQVSMITGPIFAIGLIAFFAWLVAGILDVLGSRVQFINVFTLLLCCGLIPMLQNIAGYIVVRAKGDQVVSVDQLRPSIGLDLFLPNLHGPMLAFVSFFSLFEFWYLIILTVGVAHLARCSKGKAFAAITPAWLLPLLFAVAGAAMQP